MSKNRPTIGANGLPLPILPPERDARVWAKLIRVMFYTPGFMGLLLIKTGEPASFGITVELLMLSSAAAIVGGLFIGSEATGAGANNSSKVGTWSGSLVLELLGVVPFLAAIPALFNELAHSTLLHAHAPGAVDLALGASEMLPMVAIVPFLLYQLAGFGTLEFVVSKVFNWIINLTIFGLIVGSYYSYRAADYFMERRLSGILVILMALTVVYGVLRLKQMQAIFDANCPVKEKDKDDK
jgi:hypothetical protein